MKYKTALYLHKHATDGDVSIEGNVSEDDVAGALLTLRDWADIATKRSEHAYKRYMKGPQAARHSKYTSRALLAALAIAGGAGGQALAKDKGAATRMLAGLAGMGAGGLGGYWLGRGLAHLDNDSTARHIAYKAATKPVAVIVNDVSVV